MRISKACSRMLVVALGLPWAGAQTQIDFPTQLKNLDLSTRRVVLFRSGTSLPESCTTGEAFLHTSAQVGANFYICLSTNSWVLESGANATTAPAAGGIPRALSNGKIAQEWVDFTGYQTTLGYIPLNPGNNLSEVVSKPAARTNLGLGAAATKAVQGTGSQLTSFGGGTVTPNDCVMFDASGNLVDAGAPCSAGATSQPNFNVAFTSQTTVVLAHNANTLNVLVQCFGSDNGLLIPNAITVTDANTVTVGFSSAQSGRCVVNTATGTSTATGAQTFSALSGSATIAQGGTGQTTKTEAFDALSPATAKGDMIVHDGTHNVRVAAGANGSCWIADSTLAAGAGWHDCPAGTGGSSPNTPGAGIVMAGGVVSVDSAVIPSFLTGVGSLSYAQVTNGACRALTFSLTGATTADAVAAGWPTTLEAGLLGMMRVSAADTIEVRVCNFSGASITPAAGQTFRATIVRSL